MKTQQEARELGKATVAKMKTKGWKVHTWRNGNWYVYIHKGMMTIRPFKDLFDNVHYTVTLSLHHLGASDVEFNTDRSFRDPNKAADYALKLAERHMKQIKLMIEQVRSCQL